MTKPQIVVIIAAYNAEETVSRAVSSALAEKAVAEVVVVNDASDDRTGEAASLAGAGDKRLKVIELAQNIGPSAARNLAISESDAPLIAVLDADDHILAGRFESMLRVCDWDFCADNLVFFRDACELDGFLPPPEADCDPSRFSLSFRQFVAGNISKRNKVRGELGFLKPIIRRAFLEDHGLRYDENCRLGEDFLLYARALAAGARFTVIDNCGYAALVRTNSLSGFHSIKDLVNLHERGLDLLTRLRLDDPDYQIFRSHTASIARKIAHREVLQTRREDGLLKGVVSAAQRPTAIADILADRLFRAKPFGQTPRTLLSAKDIEDRINLEQAV